MTREKSGGNAMASISRLGKAADIMEKFYKGKEIAIEGNNTGVMMTKWREALRN
jgi:hypothetical protein